MPSCDAYQLQGLMKAFRVEDLPIESKMLTGALNEAQRKVENYFFDIRKQLFEYDQVSKCCDFPGGCHCETAANSLWRMTR